MLVIATDTIPSDPYVFNAPLYEGEADDTFAPAKLQLALRGGDYAAAMKLISLFLRSHPEINTEGPTCLVVNMTAQGVVFSAYSIAEQISLEMHSPSRSIH